MAFAPGHLQQHPLPSGVVGALSLSGYQLLVDVAGVGAGRLGPQAFLLAAPDPEGADVDALTHISLHQTRLGAEREAFAYQQLAAQLGYLLLSGYRLGLERSGLRSKISLIDPASGAIAMSIPDKHPGRLFGAGRDVSSLLAQAKALPSAGPPPDLSRPELLHQTLVALALADEDTSGEQAVELADRAVELSRGDPTLDPAAALARAREGSQLDA